MKSILTGFLVFGIIVSAYAQETFPRNGVKDVRANTFAFTGATIVAEPGTVYENGLLLIKDDKIEYVGGQKAIPAGYVTVDVSGKYIYPSLIDIYTTYGIDKDKPARGGGRWSSAEQIYSDTEGAYNANEAIKSYFSAANNFKIDKKEAKSMRDMGFGTVVSFRDDGIARGTSTLVTLREDSENEAMINKRVSAHYSFDRGTSSQYYPVSAMGQIALLRQTYLDAQWYGAQNPRPFSDLALESWLDAQSLPQVFEADDWQSVLRADKVGDEFGVQYIIRASGEEYQRIGDVRSTGASFILPLNFPDAYDVDDPFDAERVSLADMKHWELAPTNPAVLASNGLSFALTTSGLSKKTDFMSNLKKAIEHGLSEDQALAALTTTPARMIKAGNMVGSLSSGKLANFIITSDKIFADKSTVHENWIQGEKYIIKSMDEEDHSGKYNLALASNNYDVEISGSTGANKAKIVVNDSTDISLTAKFEKNLIHVSFSPEDEKGLVRLTGWKTDNGWDGKGQLIDGTWIEWSMTRTGDLEDKSSDKKSDEASTPEVGEVVFPFIAHGTKALPQQETVLIKNATLWTNESDGILANTDILLKDGKIAEIGKDLSANGARVIDGTGKHVTSGVIDEHSHIGATSINDIATNSGMVRIGDVVDPESINVYRALSGGVTAVQILHGSANPIGGQSALIKLRWGESPENMKIAGADGFIKFALGENVKRSSNQNSIRFPQTRMGVEQVYMDAFSSAREYEKEWNAYNSLSKKAKANALPPRRDLAMETMLEILNGERFISCHSYVQSEINMLMKVADKFDFKINTFTHILEGYKVADKMKEHGVGASTFSDWWAYKWEVRYAIPYNAAIMHREGVVTAINSDDAEMGRRLNQEAAKSIKYGGLSEEEVWKMVTLNPAKLLHLDDRMGSLKVGKDADVVIWNGHPLSQYTIAETTFIDGKVYFSREKDKAQREYIQSERARLIQKMKSVKANGGKSKKAYSRIREDFHCDDVNADLSLLY